MQDFNVDKCDHCGLKVPIATVCPYCNHKHTLEWKQQATESANIASGGFWIAVAVSLYKFEWGSPLEAAESFLPALGTGLAAGVVYMILMLFLSSSKKNGSEEVDEKWLRRG